MAGTTPQPKSGFEGEKNRQSLDMNLADRLEKHKTMYRQSMPSGTGKGAPGIPDTPPSGEGQGVDYFGYGRNLTKNVEASKWGSQNDSANSVNIMNKGFTTGKTAGNRTSDYEGGGATAADKSLYRNHMETRKYGASDAISGLNQGFRAGKMANDSGQDSGNKA